MPVYLVNRTKLEPTFLERRRRPLALWPPRFSSRFLPSNSTYQLASHSAVQLASYQPSAMELHVGGGGEDRRMVLIFAQPTI